MPCPLAQVLPGEKPGGLAPFFSLLSLGDVKASPPPLLARMWGFWGSSTPMLSSLTGLEASPEPSAQLLLSHARLKASPGSLTQSDLLEVSSIA